MTVRLGKGFTLIELLVVIAIIAILAAILFPVFARAREKAFQASCSSNLKQLALGVRMYIQDYDNRFPGAYVCWNSTTSTGRWYLQIYPYVKNEELYYCPSKRRKSTFDAGYNGSHDGYGYNGYGNTGSNGLGWRYKYTSQWAPLITSVAKPAQMIMLADCNSWNMYGFGSVDPKQGGSCAKARHNNGVNIAFVDGHVKWISGGSIQPAPDRATVHPNNIYWVRDPDNDPYVP